MCDLLTTVAQVGFGKSDKPADRSLYTYERHVTWLQQLLFTHLKLENLTFIGQDWGGLLGLRLVAENPHAYRRFVVANTGLPTGYQALSDAFFRWRDFSQRVDVLPVGRCDPMLTPARAVCAVVCRNLNVSPWTQT